MSLKKECSENVGSVLNFQYGPIDLKFNWNDPCDILKTLKIVSTPLDPSFLSYKQISIKWSNLTSYISPYWNVLRS
jgi:hypothetical protein